MGTTPDTSGPTEAMNRQARRERIEARREARESRMEARGADTKAHGGVDLTCRETLKVEDQMNAGHIKIPDSLQQTIDNCKKTGTPRAPRPGG